MVSAPLHSSSLIFLPPSRNGVAGPVCPLLLSYKCPAFTFYLFHFHRGPSSSRLNAGSTPQPSYGSFRPNNSTPSHNPNHNPTPLFAAPGPVSSQVPVVPPTPLRRTSFAACLVIVFFQAICTLAVYRSNTLATYVDLESRAHRASMEASALIAERENWEKEKDNMRHDRETWEKVPEERVPPGAYWVYVRPVDDCRAYGKRDYRGELKNVPKSWSAIDACMNTPVWIRTPPEYPDFEIPQPYRCAVIDGSLYGYWTVDQHQDDCKPKLKDVHDTASRIFPSVLTPYSRSHSASQGCTNYGSGLTRIEAQVLDIGGKTQDWWVMCESTPFTWGGVNYTSPTHCEEVGGP